MTRCPHCGERLPESPRRRVDCRHFRGTMKSWKQLLPRQGKARVRRQSPRAPGISGNGSRGSSRIARLNRIGRRSVRRWITRRIARLVTVTGRCRDRILRQRIGIRLFARGRFAGDPVADRIWQTFVDSVDISDNVLFHLRSALSVNRHFGTPIQQIELNDTGRHQAQHTHHGDGSSDATCQNALQRTRQPRCGHRHRPLTHRLLASCHGKNHQYGTRDPAPDDPTK